MIKNHIYEFMPKSLELMLCVLFYILVLAFITVHWIASMRMYCNCELLQLNVLSSVPGTVKHVYSDHTYNEITLITKHLWIPGKQSYFFVNCALTAQLHITKSRL